MKGIRIRSVVALVVTLGCLLLAGATARAQGSEMTPAAKGPDRQTHVPILMYHYVSIPPSNSDPFRINLSVRPEIFKAQMAYLSSQGYTTISLYQLSDALLNGSPLPQRPIVLTFDDGYADDYFNVFPVLEQYHFTATFFIITGFVDARRSGYLNWDEIRALSSAGMSIEAHTVNHSNLAGRTADFLMGEMQGSLQRIAQVTGKQPRMFAYPGGLYDETTLLVARKLNLLMAVTTRHGTTEMSTNRLTLPRYRVSGDMGVMGFSNLLKDSG